MLHSNKVSVRNQPLHSSIRDLKQERRRRQWKWICVLSNLTFPGVEFLRILFRFKIRKIRPRMSTSSIKRQIRRFHVVVVQWTSKKWTKKRDARAELLFWSLKLLFFWSRRSCLSSLLSMEDMPAAGISGRGQDNGSSDKGVFERPTSTGIWPFFPFNMPWRRYQICCLRVFTVKVSGDLPKTLVKLVAQEIKEYRWYASFKNVVAWTP